jgi:hypothetical protein
MYNVPPPSPTVIKKEKKIDEKTLNKKAKKFS